MNLLFAQNLAVTLIRRHMGAWKLTRRRLRPNRKPLRQNLKTDESNFSWRALALPINEHIPEGLPNY
jgi:hypothetical protein